MDYEQFRTFMEQWIAENGGRYTSVHSGGAIDAAITAVKNKEAVWDARMIPPGGLQGQALVKKSDADFDVEWSYSVEPPFSVYGVTWDGSASPKLSRTDDAAGFTDPVPYVAGAAAYGSPFDQLMPWAGMTRLADPEAGELVAIPKFWYKLKQSGKSITIRIADGPAEGFHVSPAHMDRGDGKGERDVVYVGRYHCAAGTYKSAGGVNPKVSTTRANFRTAIHNLGETVWQIDFATRFTLWLLYIVEFADWNSQATIGKGCGNNSAVENMGYTDTMPYHTGTTLASRDTYGASTQYRNIEGLWDTCYDWLDGCYNSSDGLNLILNPANFGESGGQSVGTPEKGWIAGFKVSESGPFPVFINSDTAGGGEAAYVCDYWDFLAEFPAVCAGGNYGQSGGIGLFYLSYGGMSSANIRYGSRIIKLP